MSTATTGVRKITFKFHPLPSPRASVVEKSEGGARRRYLEGVSSGISLDGHGERMTEHAIRSFVEQANSGNILLYPDHHDVNYSEDIGKLVSFHVDEAMDWYTSYRLYDSGDGVGPVKLEKIDDIWKQANGLPPYDNPRSFGFSIEGDIPDGGLNYMDSQGRRVIDEVKLTGVVLVRNPAYRTSVASAVMKALGLPEAKAIRKALAGGLQDAIAENAAQRDYYDEKYQLQDALEDYIGTIMGSAEPDKEDRLRSVLGEYTELMLRCILGHPEVFRTEDDSEGETALPSPSKVYESEAPAAGESRLARLIRLHGAIQKIAARLKEGSDAENQPVRSADAPHGDAQ